MMRKWAFAGIVILIVLVSSRRADAASLVLNGSFELGPVRQLPDQGFIQVLAGSTTITNWLVTGQGINLIYDFWQPSDGSRSLDLNDTAAGGVQQTIATVVGQQYRLTFDLAGNPVTFPATKTLNVSAGGTSQGFSFNVTGKTSSNMGWQANQLDFTATSTFTTISFVSTTSDGFGPALDNVSVTTVPEPGAIATVAAFGLTATARRQLPRRRSGRIIG